MDLIFVDEYQDINEIQYLLLCYVVGDWVWVMVVGDLDQIIYEFWGVKLEFIFKCFSDEFESFLEQIFSYIFCYGYWVVLLVNYLICYNIGCKDVFCYLYLFMFFIEVELYWVESDSDVIVCIFCQVFGLEMIDIVILFWVWSQSVFIELKLLVC